MDHNDGSCKNCGYNLREEDDYKFCPKCGQTLETHRINFHYVTHEIQHGVLHVDKGILHTTKDLFTRPGRMIREYFEGKRKKHFSPVVFILLLTSVVLLIKHYVFHDQFVEMSKYSNSKSVHDASAVVIKILEPYINFMYSKLALLNLLGIPLNAIGYYISFKKMSRYNFFEWMLIMAFIAIQNLFVIIVVLLIQKIFPGAIQLVFFISFGLLIWTIFQLFEKEEIGKVILNFIIGLAINYFIIFVFTICGVIYIFSKHPELLNPS